MRDGNVDCSIEDRLFQHFETAAESIVVAVVTTGGMRELVLYTSNPRAIEPKYDEFISTITSGHEVQLVIQPDPKWATFARFR